MGFGCNKNRKLPSGTNSDRDWPVLNVRDRPPSIFLRASPFFIHCHFPEGHVKYCISHTNVKYTIRLKMLFLPLDIKSFKRTPSESFPPGDKRCTSRLKIHHVVFNFTVTISISFQCFKTIKNKYTLHYKTFPVSRFRKKKTRTRVNITDYGGAKNTGAVWFVWYKC